MALREHEIYWERRSNREENSWWSIKKCASCLSGSSQKLTLRVVLKYQVTVSSKGSCLDLVLDKRRNGWRNWLCELRGWSVKHCVLLPAWERSASWRCGHLEASRLLDFIFSCPGSFVPLVRGQTWFVWEVNSVLGRCWGEVGDGEHSSGAPETTLRTGLLEQARAVDCWCWLEVWKIMHHSCKYTSETFQL